VRVLIDELGMHEEIVRRLPRHADPPPGSRPHRRPPWRAGLASTPKAGAEPHRVDGLQLCLWTEVTCEHAVWRWVVCWASPMGSDADA
jgi:hypothetical protein